MRERAAIVLDVGKTLSKMTLWGPEGQLLDRRSRLNERAETAGQHPGLDAAGIERWLASSLTDFARNADVGAIIPVAHGAAAALIRGEHLLQPPLDYEESIPAESRRAYD